MKLYSLVAVGFSTIAVALSIPGVAQLDQIVLGNDDQELYLVELGPGETKLITEDEKWVLRRVCSFPASEKTRLLAVQYGGC